MVLYKAWQGREIPPDDTTTKLPTYELMTSKLAI